MSQSEQQIEQEIQAKGLNAPRITPADIDGLIVSEVYFTASDGMAGGLKSPTGRVKSEYVEGVRLVAPLDVLTFCVLVLRNGFTVTGESACASPENFNAEIGREVAYTNAREKIWQLEGYLLKQRLHEQTQPPINGQLYVIAMKLLDGSDSINHLIAEWSTGVKNSETGEMESFFLLHTPNDNYGDLLTIDQVEGYIPFNSFQSRTV